MKIILDQKLALFTSDKFLSGASGVTFRSLVLVAEKVILHHGESCDKRWYRALAMALCNNEGPTRSSANLAIKRLANILGGLETLKIAAKQLSDYIWTANPDQDNDNLKVANIKLALIGLCKAVKEGSSDAKALALASLPICHHPAILASDPNIWLLTCRRIKVDPLR